MATGLYNYFSGLSDMTHLVVHTETEAEDGKIISFLSGLDHTNAHPVAGVAVVLGTKKETATGVVTRSESAIENGTEKILPAGKVQERLEDTENVPGVGRETRNARGNGKGTEITDTDTGDLVSFFLLYILTYSILT